MFDNTNLYYEIGQKSKHGTLCVIAIKNDTSIDMSFGLLSNESIISSLTIASTK